MILIIDMKGNVVHSWETGTERARLLESGHVVVMKGSDEEHGFGTRPHRYPYDYCPQLKKLPTPEQ
jgi:hypothetical protein